MAVCFHKSPVLCQSPVFTRLFCHLTVSSPPDVSHPFLHGAFAVQYVAWRTLPLELHPGVDQHQQAQCQHAGNDDGDGLHCVRLVFQLDHHVRVAIIALRPGWVDRPQLTAHEVFEDGSWIAWLHSEELVIELPVLLPLVEVGETCGIEKGKESFKYFTSVSTPVTSSMTVPTVMQIVPARLF